MPVIELSSERFQETVKGSGIVLIDCWASWCKACEEFAPVFEVVAGKHPDHTFAKLDTEAESELVETLGISHIPTLLLYRDGVLLFKQPGYFPEAGLDDIVTQAENLDMEQVRADIAAAGGS
jgi:thioredoxin 1